jgi:hypothetical protein
MKITNTRKFVFCMNHYTQTIIISYKDSIFDKQRLRHEDWIPRVFECNSSELMDNIRYYRKKNPNVLISKRN